MAPCFHFGLASIPHAVVFIFLQAPMNETADFPGGNKAQGFSPPAALGKGYFYNSHLAMGCLLSPGRDRRGLLEVSEHVINSKWLSPHCKSYFLWWSSLEVGQDHNNSHKLFSDFGFNYIENPRPPSIFLTLFKGSWTWFPRSSEK